MPTLDATMAPLPGAGVRGSRSGESSSWQPFPGRGSRAAGVPVQAGGLDGWRGPLHAGGALVMAEDQVELARMQAARLMPAVRTALERLLREAPTPTHRGYVWKGLAAAHPLEELSAFAEAIRPLAAGELPRTLTLRELIQQHGKSCEVTEGQVLLAERDPLYALQVRQANADPGRTANGDPYDVNWQLAHEQQLFLRRHGGAPGNRALDSGRGLPPERSQEYWDFLSDRTGLSFRKVECATRVASALDAVASQLQRHIPTPLTVTGPGGQHAVLALEVDGSGPAQRFRIHDPWTGSILEATRQQLLLGNAPLGHWNRLVSYRLASPAEPAPLHGTVLPPELARLAPPPPPKRHVVRDGRELEVLAPLELRGPSGEFCQWVFPAYEYDWRGQRKPGTCQFQDVDGRDLTVPRERLFLRTGEPLRS